MRLTPADERLQRLARHRARIMQETTVAAPAIVGTDTQFIAQNRPNDLFGGNKRMQKIALANAKKAGVDTTGKWYSHEVASSCLAPDGWIGGADDVKHICKEKGYGASGSVNVDPVFAEKEDSPYQVDPAIVKERIETELTTAGVTSKSVPKKEYADKFDTYQKEMSGNLGD